jgi:CheY-specific phosphatase CheX
VQAFAEQFGINATSKPPTRRTGTSEPSEIDVASFVGLTSQTIRGTVGLCFPANTYFFLLKQATGLEIIEASTENCTGCAELMHSIFEIARPKLHKTGYPIDQAIPAFVIGKQLPVSKIIPDRGFTIVFETPGGPFQFEIGIKTGT